MVQTKIGARLAGKVAIVTGAGSGFGAAIAQRFAEEGAKVLVGDLNKDTAAQTAQKIASSDNTHEEHVLAFEMDVTIEDQWHKAVTACVEKWGKLDILVNNAGTSYKNKSTLEVTEAEFDRVFTVNVKSIFWSVRAAIPELRKAGGGSIINISSIGSERPRPGLVWYNSSKGAVSNATKGLAAEFGKDNIRVNSICPLLSGTGLFEQFAGVPFTPENVAKFVGQVPLGRLTEVDDIANAALYLASDEGKFCNGIQLTIDGGKGI